MSIIERDSSEHKHHMHREIHQQPTVLRRLLTRHLHVQAQQSVMLPRAAVRRLAHASQIFFTACGSSLHAAHVGRLALEALAGMPSHCEIASEINAARLLNVDARAVQISISQSGRTADTLAAMQLWRAQGGQLLTVLNDVESPMAALADWTLNTQAGPEKSVPATKSFTTQLTVLLLLALAMAAARGRLRGARRAALWTVLNDLPKHVRRALKSEEQVRELAGTLDQAPPIVFLGQGAARFIAAEAALKLRETALVLADGYGAGEFRHGPMALIRPGTPVVMIATQGPWYASTLEHVAPVRAAGARIIAIASAGDTAVQQHADTVLYVPHTDPLLAPVCAVIPLQLLAYHMAVRRGCTIDSPQHLQKSLST